MNTPNTPTDPAAKTTNELLTSLAGVLHHFSPQDRTAIVKAVNEHAALVAVAEAAEQARNAIRLCGLGGKSLGLEKRVEKSLETALANLAAVRGR